MQKIYKFYSDNSGYTLKENDENMFFIPRETLEFNGNDFYKTVFKEYKNNDDIQVENMMSEEEQKEDKFGMYIFSMIETMIAEIIQKINENDKV